jgi:hypothetical protein
VLWGFVAATYLGLFFLDIALHIPVYASPCITVDCNNQWLVSAPELRVLETWGLTYGHLGIYMHGLTVVCLVVYLALAVVILLRSDDEAVGLSVSIVLIILPTSAITHFPFIIAHYPNLGLPINILSWIGASLIALFVLLFPNGRFVPRWAVWVFIAMAAVIFIVTSQFNNFWSPLSDFTVLFNGALLLLLLSVIGLLIYRYARVSNQVERQQTKWAVIGFAWMLISIPIWGFFFYGDVFPPGSARLLASVVGWTLVLILLTLIPITLTIAIMRYRLWDIDVIIRRTLSYALLTLMLALIYFGSVVLLQSFFTALTGQQSPISIVISTLAIAAVFSPLRSWIQTTIDRRFYRRKYDADKILVSFSSIARQQVDLDELSAELAYVAQETMQPQHLSLWVRSIYSTPQHDSLDVKEHAHG